MIEFFQLPFKTDELIDNFMLFNLSVIMIFISIKFVKSKNLFDSIVLLSLFSIFISIMYLVMDAPDVSMTETALGACLSTCVLLNVIKIVGVDYKAPHRNKKIVASLICLLFIIILGSIIFELPGFGSADSALQNNLTKYYIENTKTDIDIASIVAAILASYRGFDTLGETAVILIAGLSVTVILSRKKVKNV